MDELRGRAGELADELGTRARSAYNEVREISKSRRMSRRHFYTFSTIYFIINFVVWLLVLLESDFDDKYESYVFMLKEKVASVDIKPVLIGTIFFWSGFLFFLIPVIRDLFKAWKRSKDTTSAEKVKSTWFRFFLPLFVACLSIGNFLMLGPTNGTNNTIVLGLMTLSIIAGSFFLVYLDEKDGWPEKIFAVVLKQIPSLVLVINWTRPFGGTGTSVTGTGNIELALALWFYVGGALLADMVVLFIVHSNGSATTPATSAEERAPLVDRPVSEDQSNAFKPFAKLKSWPTGIFVASTIAFALQISWWPVEMYELITESHTGDPASGNYEMHDSDGHFFQYLPLVGALGAFAIWLQNVASWISLKYRSKLVAHLEDGTADFGVWFTSAIAAGFVLMLATTMSGLNDFGVLSAILFTVISVRIAGARFNRNSTEGAHSPWTGGRILMGVFLWILLVLPTFGVWYGLAKAPEHSPAWNHRQTSIAAASISAVFFIAESIFLVVGSFTYDKADNYKGWRVVWTYIAQLTLICNIIIVFVMGAAGEVFQKH